MSYEIIIKKKTEQKFTARGDHTVIDKRPWTQDELDVKFQYAYQGKMDDFLKANPLKEIYGYAPDFESIKTVETEILKQTVDGLDLAAVIKAINKL